MKFLLCVLCVLCGQAVSARGDAPKAAFEKAAGELKFLSASDLLYDRLPDRLNPVEDLESHNKIITELLARPDSFDGLVPLFKDTDPKVRTLAVAALNHKNDPKLLPLLVPLCDDTAVTLPHPGLVAMIPGMDKDITPLEPQTVADFPKAILRQYLKAAGYNSDLSKFEEYWRVRKDRTFSASWFKIQFDRATQHASPVPAARAPQLQALRDRIDQLPEKDRAWNVLYLAVPDHILFDDTACLAAAKTLGPEALLETLRGRCPSTDPDLHPRIGGDDPMDQVNLWTLKHAKELLQPQYADVLLKLEVGPHDLAHPFKAMHTPWYAIAAANLAPEQSKAILLDAFKRFGRQGYADAWNRADLAIALWKQRGADESPFLINWFYGETLKDEGVPHSRCKFLEALNPKSPDTRKIIAGLIAEPRFSTLDWSSLKAMIRIINTWTARPVVSPEEMQSLEHPYGEQHVVQRPDEAAKIYPEQTKTLNDTLSHWREKLRESTGKWFN
jgi:hypothetical protein